MAIAITEPTAEVASTTNTSSYALGAFTPTAGALLVVLAFIDGNVATAPTISPTTGVTWSAPTRVTYNTTDTAALFIGQVTAGTPSSITITVNTNNGNATGACLHVHQVTGHNVIAPVAQIVTATGSAANPSFTRAAANTNNGYIAGIGKAANPPTSTPPTSWTETADTGHTSPVAGSTTAFRAGGETSTTVTFTIASGAWGGIYVEINEASVGAKPLPDRSYPDYPSRAEVDPRFFRADRQKDYGNPCFAPFTLASARPEALFPERVRRPFFGPEFQQAAAGFRVSRFPVLESKALTLFVAAAYSGPPWVGEPSAGPSRDRDLKAVDADPVVGSAYNGQASALFTVPLRITEAGEARITEDGDLRALE